MRLESARNGLSVYLGSRLVGKLAQAAASLVAFQYDHAWLDSGFSINPYSLPLTDQVFIPNYDPFNGLFGVFNDSLPDGWGALLLDRMLMCWPLPRKRVFPGDGPKPRRAIYKWHAMTF